MFIDLMKNFLNRPVLHLFDSSQQKSLNEPILISDFFVLPAQCCFKIIAFAGVNLKFSFQIPSQLFNVTPKILLNLFALHLGNMLLFSHLYQFFLEHLHKMLLFLYISILQFHEFVHLFASCLVNCN